MRKLILIITVAIFSTLSFISALAVEKQAKPKVEVSSSEYSLEVTVSDIPQDQQTLFIPIKIDTMILDFSKVALEDLSAQNILAVASSSKDKVGPGIGLIKLDEVEKGLPSSIKLKVFLKPISQGETSVSLVKVADEPALLSKGVVLNNDVAVTIQGNNEVDVTEKVEKSKKKLSISESKLTLDIKRLSQKEESIFIPIIFDNKLVDLDETFGHAIIAPGISAKTFSSSSLNEGGPGVEVLLSAEAEKDFSINVDLIPKSIGTAKLVTALPQ